MSNRQIEEEIAKILNKISQSTIPESIASVEMEGWGKVYKLKDGSWYHLEGGYFGPSTPLAIKCEEILKGRQEAID